jgi:HPt (histidine-containing phosphotransfer) domain-containing protein
VLTGLERISGQRDIYKKSLQLTIKEIEKCENKLNGFLADNDMYNFSIEVHGMKSSLANIGAMELSEQAYALETAADKADTAFCAAALPSFLEKLTNFKTSLKEAFAEKMQSRDSLEIPSELSAILKVILEKLIIALNQNDYLTIDTEVENLNALNTKGALKEEIEKINDAVLMMDYNGALGIMENLMTNPACE